MKIVYTDWLEKPQEVVAEFTFQEREFYVLHAEGDYTDSLDVREKRHCKEQKDTRIFLRKKELEELQNKKEEEVKKIQDEAIKSLSARMKFNLFFGSSGKEAQYGLMIVEQLEKIIKDK